MNAHKFKERGSALLYVLSTLTVLLAASAAVIRPVSDQYANTLRTASWQEALLAAESGIDLATLQLRQALIERVNPWPGRDPATGLLATWPSPWVLQADGSYLRTNTYSHGGEGGDVQEIEVRVDAPATLKDPTSGWQYYRVRSRGTISFGGSRRSGGEKRDLQLRKLTLVRDRRTGARVSKPCVTRTVEAIIRPSSAFPVALLSKDTTEITNHNVVVDSYDSTDPTKSTNGQWDIAKRQRRGDVATNGNLVSAGNAQIFGNVSTNGGTVTGIANITGQIRDDYYQDVPSVVSPVTNGATYTPAIARSTSTLLGSTVRGAARYKLSDITLSDNSVLTLKGTGSQINYIDIWVDGDISVTGTAAIELAKNIVVTLHVKGNMNISGNGIVNAPGSVNDAAERPANFMVYGIKPAEGVTPQIKMAGNAQIQSSIYAPDAEVEIVGGGARGSFSGSVVGKTIFMNGVTEVHYDEALAKTGMVMGYRIASWVEDIN
jgi:hypothetical protein